VIASDETSARVTGKTWWQWTFGCATAVYHLIAPTRGKCVPTAFLAGAKPKMRLSDRLPAQLRHAEEHQFCLAHLIRNAQYAIDHGDTVFAPGFKALLEDACALGRRRGDLADATIVADRALFISVAGKSLPYNTVRNVFLQLLDRTRLRGAHAGRDPRIHDLRHTFAVRSLEQCRHDRSAVAQHIVALSTYLGHAHVTDTYWYLQATPVLMGQIAEAGEALLTGGAA
jgi:hypothetical protein